MRARLKYAALFVGCLSSALSCRPGGIKSAEGFPKIYALKYGESFYPAKLVNTASTEKNIRLNWLAYLIEHGDGKRTLIDCGFSDPKLLQRFGITKFRSITEILLDLGIGTDKIDQLILTHTHFDHALDAAKFPKTRVILHEKELRNPQEPALKAILASLEAEGRVQAITGLTEFTGLRIEPVMGHTPGSISVMLTAAGRELVFTGDECYFATSCRAGIPLPPGAVYDSAANRKFIATLSPQMEILTGHETELKNGNWLNGYVFFFFF